MPSSFSVLNNFVRGGRKLSQLAKLLERDTSKRAVDAGMEPVTFKAADDTPKVTHKSGKKHRFGRRLISYERLGPFHRQVETKYLHGEAWPVMQTYFIHQFRHATKGLRRYTGGPAMRLPFTVAAPPFPQRFFGKNQRFATAY